jgi:hypothetical protein
VVGHCFHDPDVIELVRRQWRSPSPPLAVTDRYGNTLHLVREPARTYEYWASPFESGIAFAPALPAEIRADNILDDLVARLLDRLPARDLLVRIRVPRYTFDRRPWAVLEPFLTAGFEARLDLWERLVDLPRSPRELIDDATPMVRRKLREGERAAVKWRVHHGEPIAEALMRELYTAARATREQGGARLKHALETYVENRRRLIESGKAALGVLEHGSFTGYLLVLVSEELAFYFDGAWTGAQSSFGNHLLHHRMMLFLRDLGVRRYSTGYVFPDLRSASDKVAGMARFKHGLGADLSPIVSLVLARQTRKGRMVQTLRESPLGPVIGRLRRFGRRA